MFRNVYTVGLMIFAVIISAFFITKIFFLNTEYYRTSIKMSAFFIPLVMGIGAFLSVTSYSRWKKVLTFREAYGRAFIPMFVGGLLSMAVIFAVISLDKDTKDVLNYQYIESYRQTLEEEYSNAKQVIQPGTEEMKEIEKKYAESKLRIAEKVKRNEDMFSAKYFMYVFAGYNAYFLLLSLFFGSFFRTRWSERPENLS